MRGLGSLKLFKLVSNLTCTWSITYLSPDGIVRSRPAVILMFIGHPFFVELLRTISVSQVVHRHCNQCQKLKLGASCYTLNEPRATSSVSEDTYFLSPTLMANVLI